VREDDTWTGGDTSLETIGALGAGEVDSVVLVYFERPQRSVLARFAAHGDRAALVLL